MDKLRTIDGRDKSTSAAGFLDEAHIYMAQHETNRSRHQTSAQINPDRKQCDRSAILAIVAGQWSPSGSLIRVLALPFALSSAPLPLHGKGMLYFPLEEKIYMLACTYK